MNSPAKRLMAVQARIREAERLSGRPEGSVGLVAVSKTFSADAIRALAESGQRRFGESYLGEALTKIEALRELGLEWHFIGPIQSNKTRGIATHFAWAHGIDRARIAARLSEQRPPDLPPLQVCIQVNISGEASKSGIRPEDALALVREIIELPRLRLRGLMAIPAPAADAQQSRSSFRRLHELLLALQERWPTLDTLSMGMSDDLEAAIAEGATLVRVGSALFGARPPAQP
ncbi:MAG: YggS family pyridoxal phosphate-dependent enzyme [Gammaproteobacteria bacterium]|jgi:pyridoxal phosphate enzyme (YggS family)|nr:YggS family pyridoxal phosphate-dependent enzyme [Gammaproteobacteria bacterium]